MKVDWLPKNELLKNRIIFKDRIPSYKCKLRAQHTSMNIEHQPMCVGTNESEGWFYISSYKTEVNKKDIEEYLKMFSLD